SEPEMDPEEDDGDNEKSEGDSIDYPTSRGDDDVDDDGDDLLEDDADEEDKEESSDSEEEEEEHLALTVPAPALHSPSLLLRILIRQNPLRKSIYGSDEICRTIYIYCSTTIEDTTDKDTTAVTYTTKRTRFTTPTGGYEVGESSAAAAARQIRPALTVDDSRRAEDRLISRLRKKRRYFRTLSTTYTQEVAHSRDYCTQIMDYYQSRDVHTSTLVTQIEALQRDVSTLQGQQIDDEDRLTRHIQHEHAQRDAAPEDGDSCS
nr:hypothetical protein [Tanacetum cinerariifolium]